MRNNMLAEERWSPSKRPMEYRSFARSALQVHCVIVYFRLLKRFHIYSYIKSPTDQRIVWICRGRAIIEIHLHEIQGQKSRPQILNSEIHSCSVRSL